MPKQSAFDAFWAFWQSLSEVPLSPVHELAVVAVDADVEGEALIFAEPELPVLVVDCASNGVTNIIDIAQAIALVFHRFINPPLAHLNMLRCQAHGRCAMARMRRRRARPSME